jgi:hypothetical protein
MMLFAAVAMGQTAARTTRIPTSGIGSSSGAGVTVYNSTLSAYAIANRAAFVGVSPCIATGTINTAPVLYAPGVGTTTFDYKVQNWSYPDNTLVTALTYQFCYTLNGTIDTTMYLRPAYKNKLTGTVVVGPDAVVASGPPPGYVWKWYPPPTNLVNASRSSVLVWNLPTPIASMDLGNYEFGFSVNHNNYPYAGQGGVFWIFGVQVFADVIPTPYSGYTGSLATTYTREMVFANSRFRMTYTMPSPSTAHGLQIRVRCPNGAYARLDDIAWGVMLPQTTPSYIVSAMNSACAAAGSSAFAPGNTTNFAIQAANRYGQLVGPTVYSQSTIL